ncbi:MAG: NAD(P)H-hydrate dehydratase [Spirochaetaceae bacterium]|nr:NAD(P)H-hydrate dehydratase [Spirochaetaceae bacterium]
MQNVFFDSRILDRVARERFCLSEEIMMENAATALQNEIAAFKRIVILAGAGNNGADGFTLARRIFMDTDVTVICTNETKTQMGGLQKERAQKCGVRFLSYDSPETPRVIAEADSIVDCVFGAGFHGALSEEIATVVRLANAAAAFRVACDIPSGLDADGNAQGDVFCADVTVCMGSLKIALLSDTASDFTGIITVCNLGISRALFERGAECHFFALEKSDMRLPVRSRRNVHKGSFGHVAVLSGEKAGASVIAGSAAFAFGAGLVSLVRENAAEGVPFELMQNSKIPEKTTAVAFGMGFGFDEQKMQSVFDFLLSHKRTKAVLDADVFSSKALLQFLDKNENGADEKRIVLTPHPKEFLSLLKNACLCAENTSIADVVRQKVEFARAFCARYKKTVLVVKGAIPVISSWENGACEVFFNPLGKNCLAKGGSGDVLSGLTAALLAQGYSALEAAVSASLAHAIASEKIDVNDYALSPFSLIDAVKRL